MTSQRRNMDGGRVEERQQLLSGEGGRESDDDCPPVSIIPPHLPPQPSLQSVDLHTHPPTIPPPLPPHPIPHEAPPAYQTELPPYTEVKPVGIPVQIQVEGRTVMATLIQEPHSKHMVYISDQPGESQGQTPPSPPKDFLMLALLGFACCCFPLAVVALIRSLEVPRLYRQGNYSGALKASRQAQSWGMAAVIFGLCIFVLPVIMRLYFLHPHHYTYAHYGNSYYDYSNAG